MCAEHVWGRFHARACVQDTQTLDIPDRDYAHVCSDCFNARACVQDAQRYILSTGTMHVCRTCVGSFPCARASRTHKHQIFRTGIMHTCAVIASMRARASRTHNSIIVSTSIAHMCSAQMGSLQCVRARPGHTAVDIPYRHQV
jgi:hypothetical protein